MKNRTWLIAVILLLSATLLSACGTGDSEQDKPSSTEKEGQTVYEGENLPAFLAKSGDLWFAINQTYGENEYSLACGSEPGKMDVKYKAAGQIFNLSVDGEYAVWGQVNDNTVTINLYNAKDDSAKVIAEMPEEENAFQQAKTYTKDGKVYYERTDYSEKTFSVVSYDVATGKEKTLTKEKFDQISGCFSMADGKLIYQSVSQSGGAELAILDPDSEKVERMPLPDGIELLYDADVRGDTVATYYYDGRSGEEAWNETDNIAVFHKGDKDVIPVFSFPTGGAGETYYAYNDNIELFGDNVLWIYQKNITGEISDHYTLCIYDYKENQPTEEDAAFQFMADGETLYWLSFVDGADKVKLHKGV